MTDEEIKYASKDYVNYLLDKQEYHNVNYTEDDIRQAFEKGAKWADSYPINVWHDASEEPVTDSYILYVSIYDDIFTRRYNRLYSSMGTVKKWAYVNDLLPKGGEHE